MLENELLKLMLIKYYYKIYIFFHSALLLSCSRTVTNTSFNQEYRSIDFQREMPELLDAVQLSGIYPDSKTFVDFPLRSTPERINQTFEKERNKPGFDLRSFVSFNFDTTLQTVIPFYTRSKNTILRHIDTLWYVLTRYPDSQQLSSLIPLKHPYIVPGGRFREIYYWDSYFTMLGLAESGRMELIKNMVDNFSDLISTFGYIPNGNRTYYLSRSQPPFFASMVNLLAGLSDSVKISDYLPQLEREYHFWMNGREKLTVNSSAIRRVVMIDDSTILNRYWDDLCLPRPESYKEDVAIFRSSGRDSSIFRDIRATAESGWDFSSRWFADGSSLESIVTTQIIPVDLNSLLYNMEKTISRAYTEIGDSLNSSKYRRLAESRARAINRILWDSTSNYYQDYNYIKREPTGIYSLAALYTLYYRIADRRKATFVKNKIGNDFLFNCGVATTLTLPSTHQQWDYPNGWAPLQWITYSGLAAYGYKDLASTLAKRWMGINELIYYGMGDPTQKGKLLEKYNVVDGTEGRGGEYPLQDGFGWTNGVYRALYSCEVEHEWNLFEILP